MPQKNTPPLEITLEKNASGIWNVPEAPKRQITSWQRLCLYAAGLYLLLLVGSCQLLLPTQESIQRRMVFTVTEEVKRFDGLAFAGESPRRIFEAARSQGFELWVTRTRAQYHIGPEGDAGFSRIDRDYRNAIANLPIKRAIGALFCSVAFLVPISVLYAFSRVVGWFQRQANIFQKN